MTLTNKASKLVYRVQNKVAAKAGANNSTIDPLTILSIAGLILKILQIILDWYKDRHKAANSIKSLGWFKKMLLWHIVRKDIKDRQTAKYVYASICEALTEMTDEDRLDLFTLEK